MRFSAIPFGAVTVLLFVSPFAAGSRGNAVVLFVSAMLFYLCMTCYCTPYNALIPELGRTQNARINLSTFISVTYFIGTAISYLVPNIAGIFMQRMSYAASYRVTVGILAIFAVICMLTPAFLIDENVYADTKPTSESPFRSLVQTLKNKHFVTFAGSDILYWLALTMFQTGLSYYITVLMGLSDTMTFPLFAVMTFCSLLFYAPVNLFAKKLGKKKLITFAFLFFSVTFLFTGFAGILPLPGLVSGGIVAILASAPMAILGILPQAVVADIAEADKADTGESRSGMFYAARTFLMKLGQSAAMLLFTSISDNRLFNSISNAAQAGTIQDGIGYRITAFAAAVLCLLGGLVFLRYNESKVIEKTTT
jgi:GPH family glycoside/pentoside/hexuronide:cation symporter